MTVSDLTFIATVLQEELSEDEIAAVITLLDNDTLDFSDVFDNDSIEALKAGEEPEIIIDVRILDSLNIMENTVASCIEVKTVYGNKYDFIVTDDLDDAEKCAENEIEDYGKNYGLDDFDIDIVDYVELDFFKNWYDNKLTEEAKSLLQEPSDMFENGLVEYLYEEDALDKWSFEYDENGDPDYKKCTEDDELLIDDYLWHNEIKNETLIQMYINEEGMDAFESALNSNEIEIDWKSLTQDCIEQDGIERYLSINNQMNKINIGDNVYYTFLWHSNERI